MSTQIDQPKSTSEHLRSRPEKHRFGPQKEKPESLPTIHFQVQTVSFREDIFVPFSNFHFGGPNSFWNHSDI